MIACPQEQVVTRLAADESVSFVNTFLYYYNADSFSVGTPPAHSVCLHPNLERFLLAGSCFLSGSRAIFFFLLLLLFSLSLPLSLPPTPVPIF